MLETYASRRVGDLIFYVDSVEMAMVIQSYTPLIPSIEYIGKVLSHDYRMQGNTRDHRLTMQAGCPSRLAVINIIAIETLHWAI